MNNCYCNLFPSRNTSSQAAIDLTTVSINGVIEAIHKNELVIKNTLDEYDERWGLDTNNT